MAAFKKLMAEFDFNMTASVQVDLDTNSSRSLQQVSQDIMAEISSDLQMFQKLSEPLMYGGLVLLGWAFVRSDIVVLVYLGFMLSSGSGCMVLCCSVCRAVQYRRRYLSDLSFDNIYINAQFKELDQQVSSGGGASVLPLSRREAQTYITPCQCKH